MNKYQNLLAQTYDLTAQGKLAEFSTFLAADATWTESAGFPYAGTYRESGKSFTADFVHYYTFNKDDKIARFVQIVDSVPVVEAMQK